MNRQAVTFGPPVQPGRRVCRNCCQLLTDDKFGRVQSEKRLSIYNAGSFQQNCKACIRELGRAYYREKRGHPAVGPLPPRGKPVGYTYVHRGYVLVKVGPGGHPRADRNGYVYQHILVAEEKYGIPITREFTVHHRDRDKANNHPDNLELRVGNHGKGGDLMPTLLAHDEVRDAAIAQLRLLGYHIQEPVGASL